jgi:beta-1,4-mannosyltransferase
MQYHALALAKRGVEVDVVAHRGHEPSGAVLQHPLIALHLIEAPTLRTRAGGGAGYAALAAADALVVAARALHALLLRARRPDVVLVQTPPAFPSLALAWLAARLRAARLVVDWHNLTHSMLALRVGEGHPLTRFVRRYEVVAGRGADAHLCVSAALAAQLGGQIGRREARVLYDRPASAFAPLPAAERAEVRARLFAAHDVPAGAAMLLSSTSWSADEDFELLLEALALYDDAVTAPLFVLVTGDGPGRRGFEERARARVLRNVHVRTAWVSAAEYPRVLAAADAGVCLHRSASGLDLPMKLADMAGAGLPVCAFDYGPCLSERFRAGHDGLLFKSAEELAGSLRTLLAGHATLVERADTRSWDEGWEAEARASFYGVTSNTRTS